MTKLNVKSLGKVHGLIGDLKKEEFAEFSTSLGVSVLGDSLLDVCAGSGRQSFLT